MMTLDKTTLRTLAKMLRPLLTKPDDAHELLILAYGMDHPLLEQINYGALLPATLIERLLAYGDAEPGIPALWVLLDFLIEDRRVGDDQRQWLLPLKPKIYALSPHNAPPPPIPAPPTDAADAQRLADLIAQIDAQPGTSEPYAERGVLYQRLGDHARAIDDFTAAISRREANPEYFRLRAASRAALEDYTRAIHDYSRALELAAHTDAEAQVRYERGGAYWLRGDWDRAERDYRRAAELGHAGARAELAKF